MLLFKELLAIGLGGAAGAMCRWSMVVWVQRLLGPGYPWATLVVNAVGSFVLGFLVIWFLDRTHLSDLLRLLITVGFLGSFTTFSTFAVETVRLIELGSITSSLIHTIGSVALCIAMAWLGMLLAKTSFFMVS